MVFVLSIVVFQMSRQEYRSFCNTTLHVRPIIILPWLHVTFNSTNLKNILLFKCTCKYQRNNQSPHNVCHLLWAIIVLMLRWTGASETIKIVKILCRITWVSYEMTHVIIVNGFNGMKLNCYWLFCWQDSGVARWKPLLEIFI